MNDSYPSELVVSSLDVHRVLGLRAPHRAWMLRKLARFKPHLGIGVFDAKASAALVVIDGVVVSFAPGGAGLFLSLNTAVCMVGAGYGRHGMLFYRWINWFETAPFRTMQAQADRFDANRERIMAALAVRKYAGEPPGTA